MDRLIKSSGILVILLLWVIFADLLKIANSTILPSLGDTILALFSLDTLKNIATDLAQSGMRWFYGYLSGSIIAIILGLVIGSSKLLQKSSLFVIEFFRCLPVTALFPIFLLLFGMGNLSKIAMIAYASFFIVLINTIYGVIYQNKTRAKMANIFGCSKYQKFQNITFFGSLPQIFIGLRLALSISLIITIVAEMFIGSDMGIGQSLYNSFLTLNSVMLYGYLIIVGITGYLLNILFLKIEKKILYWVQ